ncbi:hypothetical protein OS493_038380, partial [Desmophyllum pertusum]
MNGERETDVVRSLKLESRFLLISVSNQRLTVIKEINHFQVTRKANHQGTGSYGSCYIRSYRGLDVVVKELKVKELRRETPEHVKER